MSQTTPDRLPASLPALVDAAIIGGGPAGCSAASWLTQLGLSVALIERAPRLCDSLPAARLQAGLAARRARRIAGRAGRALRPPRHRATRRAHGAGPDHQHPRLAGRTGLDALPRRRSRLRRAGR
ncbi:FAD-dependent oxidoreductase [Roseateles sp. UC29_93]|uniref:FAD-dependent oxidoreductase n=1 Tax=Roseateles sp. UC29_93 TaxID=3350177 RepID=UPI00366CD1D7